MSWVNVDLPIKRAEWAKDIQLPCYMTNGAAGMDLHAAVESEIEVASGQVALVPTGLYTAVPEGHELQIRPRSGLALKNGIGILNSPGTIDSDYRGEIKIIIINMGQEKFIIKRNDRIAQAVLSPVSKAVIKEVNDLPPTERSGGGFGHTG